MVIKINITNKRAKVEGAPVIVCGNSGYTIEFTFDAEWDQAAAKTARFVYAQGGMLRHTDVEFTGNTVKVPYMVGIRSVQVGVFVEGENISTTTPAKIACETSIRCEAGVESADAAAQYEAGQKAAHTAFWNAFQHEGDRVDYYNAFRNWPDESYDPIFPITCTGATSAGEAGGNVFYSSGIKDTKVPIVATDTNVNYMFARCTRLETIPLLELNGVTGFSQTFAGCTVLENITVAGSIGKNFNISATPVLSAASVQSIVNALADLTGQDAQTLTFHSSIVTTLTDEQTTAIFTKNWNIM